MSNKTRVLHVRSAASPLIDDVDAWVASQSVECVRLGDAFDACTYALTHFEAAPALAFVGCDALPADERQVIRYLRQIWPALAIIVYGSDVANAWSSDPLLVTAGTRSSLGALLARSAAELVAHVRRAQASNPRRAAPLSAPVRAPESRTPVRPREEEEQEDLQVAASPAAESVWLEAPPARASGGPPPILSVPPMEPASVSLTAEELAALLEDAGD